MAWRGGRKGSGWIRPVSQLILAICLAGLPTRVAGYHDPLWRKAYLDHHKRNIHKRDLPKRGPPEPWDDKLPLWITNNCQETIWPGVGTQFGTGPGTGGFELPPNMTNQLWVGATWEGRVWGRTNCTVSGNTSCVCATGDCSGQLDCQVTGAVPSTLAEIALSAGIDQQQTFYDMSLVDGYNLPLGISYIPAPNTSFIPPNLVNVACIATAGWLWAPSKTSTIYSNATYPIPWQATDTNDGIRDWCPFDLLAFPPPKPGDGVYPYPTDNIFRPDFSPCKSRCAATGSPQDCCVGKYSSPDVCKPSDYSTAAKAVCPDAYSYAFDDQTSTFIIPHGGGWQVTFCPDGRSTNILRTLGPQLSQLASAGNLSEANAEIVVNVTYIEEHDTNGSSALRPAAALVAALAGVLSLLLTG